MEEYIEKNIVLLYNVLSFVIDDHPELDEKTKLIVELLGTRNTRIIQQNKKFLYTVLTKINSLQKRQDQMTDNEFYNEIYKELIKTI